ncbi:hypothetical protein MMYC01_207570 [Madurella mycetomatis]|uniref:Uncharacterized protein n=1 Tax=Madurella mycetomatis TaxID=100816 RepID=A0A175W0I8_9PEZI|nr:hypothetical protein MMYC01_207570 [Madurella mycetomatis]
MAQLKVAPQHALRVTPYTHLDHMASSEVPNDIVDDNHDAPIFETINFPRYPDRPMEPVDTAPTQAPDEPSNGDYSAPIHMVLNFTDAVDEAASPPESLGQATTSLARAPVLSVHTMDGPAVNTSASYSTTEQNAAPPLPPTSYMPPHGPSVTIDQVKEMIRAFVQEAVRSLKHLFKPKCLFEMASTLGLDAQNRPLPKDEDEVASHLEERFEKLMAANGVPNNAPDGGRQEDERVSNGEPERNRAALASKLEYKRGDDGDPQSFQRISLWDQYAVVTD